MKKRDKKSFPTNYKNYHFLSNQSQPVFQTFVPLFPYYPISILQMSPLNTKLLSEQESLIILSISLMFWLV